MSTSTTTTSIARMRRLPRPIQRCDPTPQLRSSVSSSSASSSSSSSSRDPQDMFTDERRAELVQFLLRDLQIEGVPILSVDTNDGDSGDRTTLGSDVTLQAAVWTTLSTLYTASATATTTATPVDADDDDSPTNNDDDSSSSSSSSNERRDAKKLCCLVLEGVSIASLRSLVNGYAELQQQQQQQQQQQSFGVPELSLFQLSLLGNGMGPAIVISQSPTMTTTTRHDVDTITDHTKDDDDDDDDDTHDQVVIDAMQRFVRRLGVVPHRHEATHAPVVDTDCTLRQQQQQQQLQPNVHYRSCQFGDAFHIMTAIWNAACEIIATTTPNANGTTDDDDDDTTRISDLFLVLPKVTMNRAQWQAFTRLYQWSFRQLTRTDVELQSYHPNFEDLDDDDRQGATDPTTSTTTTSTANTDDTKRLQQIINGITLVIPNVDETTSRIMSERLAAMMEQELSQRNQYRRRSPVPAIRLHRVNDPRQTPLVSTSTTTSIHSDGDFFRGMAHAMTIPLADLQSELENEMNMIRNGPSRLDT